MKIKIFGYSLEIIIIGVGVVVARFADAYYWIGFILIGVGILGVIITAWKNITSWIPIRIVKKERISRKNVTNSNRGEITWLDGLIREQRNYPQKYLYPRLHKLFVSSSSELGIEVEWFNCSIFGIEFTSLSGEVHINSISIGHQIKLRNKFVCSPCDHCLCTFDIMVDASMIKLVQDAISKAERIKCGFVLNWDVNPDEVSKPFLKSFMKQWSEENIVTIPK